jgi:hypothetical protein
MMIAKTGEEYDGIKGIWSEHGRKGGKAFAEATQDTCDENFEKHCSDLVIFKGEKGHCNWQTGYTTKKKQKVKSKRERKWIAIYRKSG